MAKRIKKYIFTYQLYKTSIRGGFSLGCAIIHVPTNGISFLNAEWAPPPSSSIKLMKMMSKKKDGLIHFIYTYTPTPNIYTWYC